MALVAHHQNVGNALGVLRHVLVVEADAESAKLERDALASAGAEVSWVTTAVEASTLLRERAFTALLVDCRTAAGELPGLLEGARGVPVVLMAATESLPEGVADCVRKVDGFWQDLPRVIERVVRLAAAEQQLRAEQARLAEVQRLAQLGSWEWDVVSNIVSWSDELFRIFGRDPATFGASYQAFLECVHPADRDAVNAVIYGSYETQQPFQNVYRVLQGTRVRYVEGRGSVSLSADGRVRRMTGTAQDVTEREEQQAKLRESEAFFAQSLDMLSTAGVDGYFRRVSPGFQVLGYSEEELLTTPFIELVHPDDVASTLAEVEKLKLGVKTLHFENRYRCKDGTYRWISWVSSPTPEGTLYGTGRDVTERKRAEVELNALNERLQDLNESLTRTLKERDVLLQEIHHRVKNNLQVICSLISLQLRKLEPGENRDALSECRTRVQAIALIHEQLYQSRDYARVPFAAYVRSLGSGIFDAGAALRDNVRLELKVDDVRLPVDQAIPCGLVLNELITNALKHGFKDGRSGSIHVELSKTSAGVVTLEVHNDGIALPADFERTRATSLGLQLIATLASQLGARLSVRREPATSFQLSFSAQA
jgi:PAS domain S-box-containing protein